MRLPISTLFPRYRDRLFAMALGICRDPDDADDAVQNTFIKYTQTDKEFESEEHLKAWLMRVVINQAKDISASFWRRHRSSLEDYTETLTFAEPSDGALFDAVMRLPEKYRIVIHLYYYEDYSVSEIAEILHARENTVKTQLRRGRDALKKSLGEDWQNDEP